MRCALEKVKQRIESVGAREGHKEGSLCDCPHINELCCYPECSQYREEHVQRL